MSPDEKPKPKRKAPAKKKPTAAEVEAKASAEAAESVPKADDEKQVEKTPAAEVEASSEEDKPKAPAKKPRKKAEPKAEKAEKTDKAEKKADDKPAKPARKRDQPRAARQPGEPAVSVRAQARYVRTSARKARLVCDHIRGKDVEQARAILSFTPRGAAKPWLKLLESAIANAEHNHELVGDELKIASIHADEGPTLKRYRPRAMGRATRIRKRTSHLTITLTPKE
jgi:ribosomal protein L22